MAEETTMRLSLAAKKINVGLSTIVERLSAKGFKVEQNPNFKLTGEHLQVLAREFHSPDLLAQEPRRPAPEVASVPVKSADDGTPLYFREPRAEPVRPVEVPKVEVPKPKVEPTVAPPVAVVEPVVAKEEMKPAVVMPPAASTPPAPTPPVPAAAPENKLPGLTVLGKIDLNAKPVPTPPPAPKPEAPRPSVVPAPAPVEAKAPVVLPAPEPTPPKQPEVVTAIKPSPTPADAPPSATQAVVEPAPPVAPPKPQPPVPAPPVPVAAKPVVLPAPAKPTPPPTPDPEPAKEPEVIEAKAERLQGLTVLGKIELPVGNGRNGRNPVSSSDSHDKRKRKRINRPEATSSGPRPSGNNNPTFNPAQPRPAGPNQGQNPGTGGGNRPPQQGTGNRPSGNSSGGSPNRPSGSGPARPGTPPGAGTGAGNTNRRTPREEPSDRQIQDQIKATMARLSGTNTRGNQGADRRRARRRDRAAQEEDRQLRAQEESKTLKVTEFISANDLASLMDASVNEVISVCMSLGMFVSINQRLDAEAITIITDEFGFGVQFVSAEEEVEAALMEVEDTPENLQPRAPIVTIMGHVDHGKTSLLDYVRRTKVAAGEAGGITQHIGAYDVETESGKRITFLDTPGHEAFTAMRARGAQVTDVVIIVIAADDSVMPQTREAINHAQNANVPIVFAFSKVDKPGADTEKIRQELAQMNLLVEEWGGKYQTQEISSKSGLGVSDLLEKVLLEAELLDLKANPNKRASGAVIEASLDKGRGYVTTLLVQNGSLNVGDVMLAGENFGRVKAMFDHLGNKVKTAGPSTPVQVLGLNGAPQAGDKLNAVENEREAREIANKREQILREQNLRTRKHITLEEIGRRKAIGTFKELNVIVKGDVDGSVEALSDSLLKLSTEEVQVRIIHKGVGQVSESDVLLASTSDAVVVAFQVRPSVNAKRIAEQEQIEIRNYSIIYDAINDVRDAMEGLLAPTMEENVTANIEVREVFKISKIGTVAGCYVLDGTVKRNHKIRLVRDFIVVHNGEISALKRFKDDVAEVRAGYECGLSIRNFHDIEVGDTIECYEIKEVKRTL